MSEEITIIVEPTEVEITAVQNTVVISPNQPILEIATGTTILTGPRGYSAYEVAVQNGFVGTEEEWLDSLIPKNVEWNTINW